ncbi:hypothetical protein N7494_010375 [Penicillium frequentans]|uniref:Uncharacterized protein n=1 Tax=Penicillium frequentans TaxID=3151616 RepID=A0AAD6CJG7_9EURO|nr:hypothetical protein N7494_010375 [Penicillium glabrum]
MPEAMSSVLLRTKIALVLKRTSHDIVTSRPRLGIITSSARLPPSEPPRTLPPLSDIVRWPPPLSTPSPHGLPKLSLFQIRRVGDQGRPTDPHMSRAHRSSHSFSVTGFLTPTSIRFPDKSHF